MIGSLGWKVVRRQISLSSSNGSSGGRIDCLGHSDDANRSHTGPFHHNSWSISSNRKRPPNAQSAGFSLPLTFHLSGAMCSTIDETLLPT